MESNDSEMNLQQTLTYAIFANAKFILVHEELKMAESFICKHEWQ